MGEICTACGAEIPDRYRRCGACGTPREIDAPPVEIRRFATVVNSDLKGSTALGERLDPETLRGVLTLYFDEMRAVFESHGGTIEKIIGDAIVAVFGIPVQRDDDALRAVEASAESQRALASLNDRLDETYGVRLVVRTGVATGDVLVGEATAGQHVLTGDTMAISSAMEQNSPPLEVLLDSSTYELVRDQVEVEVMEPVTPKGRTEARDAYRLISVETRADGAAATSITVADGMRWCPSCGEENPEDFRVCGMCGATLPTGEVFRESRKTVTIVFADPKPTSLDGGPPNPEAIRDVMPRYFETMKAALEHHGATVERFIGDAVMAVFGLPVRHEDDAVRGVRAAAAMQEALPALNERFRAEWNLEIRNHIGVNTGEVIAGDASVGQRLVTGDTVNTAARLEQAAGAGEIVLGGLTYRLARDEIEVEAIPPLSLKGKAEPVAAFRLVRVLKQAAQRAEMTTPFVGRREEMDHLETTLLEVSATRSCELRMLIGEAGVGKSRIVREFATRASARDRSQVLRGRCLPYGDGVTFWPIGEIVRAAAGINDEDPLELALEKIAVLARGTDDPTAVADRVAAAIGLSTAQYPGPELFWGIRRLLEAIASRRPLVAIVDDIHVAAPTFLELLDHLLDTVHGAPILILATARHELLETRAEWAEGHEMEQMVLGPLTANDADEIVGKLLGALEPAVRSRILDTAEGNPLYVEQISSMLVETGALVREGDHWIATTSSEELAIPPTVEALVASRLDALKHEEREVIDPASVIGMGFALDAVTHLVPVPAASDVPDRLHVLTAKQFVRPTVAEEDFYRFGHSVIKDAAYKSLLKRDRADLHERFVGWAEPVNRERGRELEFEEILGYHLEQAYRYRTELGPLDEGGREVGKRAGLKLSSAGRRAFARGDAPAAANLLRRATSVVATDDPWRVGLLPELAEAYTEQGDFPGARAVLDEGAEIANGLGDTRLMARIRMTQMHVDFYSGGMEGGIDKAVGEVESIAETLETADDAAGLARAWRLLMGLHGTAGRYERAGEAAQRLIAEARRSGEMRLVGTGIVNYSVCALHGPTNVEDALERCRELVGAIHDDRKAEAVVLSVLAVLYAMHGEAEPARDAAARSRANLVDLGMSMTGASTSIESTRVEMLGGNPAGAEQELRRDHDTLAAMGETYFRSSLAGLLAHALWALERYDEADRYASVAEELADEDDVDSQVIWRSVRAKLLARSGQTEDGVTLAEGAVAKAAETDDIDRQADALRDLAEVRAIAGAGETEGPALRQALELYERKGDEAQAARIRTRLTEASPA